MKAFNNPIDTKERRKSDVIITVPNMVEPLGNSIRQVLRNPVDRNLEMYSSHNPDLLDPIDLKMMSRLDRLRMHNELRVTTGIQRKELDDKLLKSIKEKKNRDKKKEEEKVQEKIKEEAEKLNKKQL